MKKYIKPRISGMNDERGIVPLAAVGAAVAASVAAAEAAVGAAALASAAGVGFASAMASKKGHFTNLRMSNLLKVEKV